MVMPCGELRLTKLPEQWHGLFKLLFRGPQHHKLCHAWYRRSCGTKTSWDELLQALVVLEPVIQHGCLQFHPLLACFSDAVAVGFLDFLLCHQDGVSADSLERFIHSLLQSLPASHTISATLLKSADILTSRGISVDVGQRENRTDKAAVRPDENSHTASALKSSDFAGSVSGETRTLDSHESTVTSVKTADKETLNPLVPVVSSTGNSTGSCMHKGVKQVAEESAGDMQVMSLDIHKSKDKGPTDMEEGGKADAADTSVIYIDHEETEEKPGGEEPEIVAMHSMQQLDRVSSESQEMEEERKAPDQGSVTVGALDMIQPQLLKLKDAWLAGEKEALAELDVLTSVSPSQMDTACGMLGLQDMGEASLGTVAEHLVVVADRLSSASSTALLHSVVGKRFSDLEASPSRQFTACLTTLGAAFPRQIVKVLCDTVSGQSCTAGQAETLVALCKTLDIKMLTYLLGELCQAGAAMNDSTVGVMQCVVDLRPELTPALITSALTWLETAARLEANSAKYGRLVLNFIKGYRGQFDATHAAAVRVIVDAHKSFTRRSLQQAVKNLPH